MRAAVALQEQVLKSNPAVARNRRSLALSRLYLGRLLADGGRPDEAASEYRLSIALLRTLLDENGESNDLITIMAEVRSELGLAFLYSGRLRDAEAECRAAELACRKLGENGRDPAVYQTYHAQALWCLGDVVYASGRAGEARGLYEHAIRLTEPLARNNPRNAMTKLLLVGILRCHGLALRDLGDFAAASVAIRRAVQLSGGLADWPECRYEVACCHAALADLAERAGSGVPAAEGPPETAAAMMWLGRAVDGGYRNRQQFRIDPAFAALRGRADFQKLLASIPEQAPPPRPVQ